MDVVALPEKAGLFYTRPTLLLAKHCGKPHVS